MHPGRWGDGLCGDSLCGDGRFRPSSKAQPSRFLQCSRRPALPRVHRLIIQTIRSPQRHRDILPRTTAGIDKSTLAQQIPSSQIKLPPLTLRVRRKRASTIRPLLPGNPEPVQILHHGLHEFRPAPLSIQILIPQNQRPAALGSPLRSNPKRPRMPHMQQAGRRRRKPPAIRFCRIRHRR